MINRQLYIECLMRKFVQLYGWLFVQLWVVCSAWHLIGCLFSLAFDWLSVRPWHLIGCLFSYMAFDWLFVQLWHLIGCLFGYGIWLVVCSAMAFDWLSVQLWHLIGCLFSYGIWLVGCSSMAFDWLFVQKRVDYFILSPTLVDSRFVWRFSHNWMPSTGRGS